MYLSLSGYFTSNVFYSTSQEAKIPDVQLNIGPKESQVTGPHFHSQMEADLGSDSVSPDPHSLSARAPLPPTSSLQPNIPMATSLGLFQSAAMLSQMAVTTSSDLESPVLSLPNPKRGFCKLSQVRAGRTLSFTKLDPRLISGRTSHSLHPCHMHLSPSLNVLSSFPPQDLSPHGSPA